MGAGGVQVDPERVRVAPYLPRGVGQVVDRLGDGLADARDDLDGVAQQLLVQAGLVDDRGVVQVHLVEELGCLVRQVARGLVDERDLPLDAHRGAGRAPELDGHDP